MPLANAGFLPYSRNKGIFAGVDLSGDVVNQNMDDTRTYYGTDVSYEGYSKGDARSRLIVSNVTLKEFINGTPPCHARFEDLVRIGIDKGSDDASI